jgi:exodeoxyribonuclease VIII
MKIESLKNFASERKGQALIYKDIPNEDYHAGVGISSSYIRRFGQSQLHAVEHKQESTPALKFGTAAHSLIVEGREAFDKEVKIVSGSPYTKAYKEEKADYEEQGYIVLKEAELELLESMKANMIYEGNAYLNAKGKVAEASIYWYEDDVLCKCRPDLMCPPLSQPNSDSKIVIVDYKTTISCEPYAFNKSVSKYGYDMQASWYRRGLESAGYSVDGFVFIAQEKTHPYASKVFRITKEQMDYAWKVMERYLEEYKEYQQGKPLSIYNSPNIVDLVFE